jgi:hypothetical protein
MFPLIRNGVLLDQFDYGKKFRWLTRGWDQPKLDLFHGKREREREREVGADDK